MWSPAGGYQGSNGARLRLWKVELQKFADETALVIHVHHYPPGTSNESETPCATCVPAWFRSFWKMVVSCEAS